ncbi:MAG TPA: Grx4 family monothiol glutaredoxin [Vulgatibacter sp.]
MNEDLKKRIDELVHGHRVVLFMKGSPFAPMCGFSASAIQTLREAGATDVASVNVLTDPEIREGIKEYSNWPTIPQIYIDGKFVGGCDIIKDLQERGELAPMIKGS